MNTDKRCENIKEIEHILYKSMYDHWPDTDQFYEELTKVPKDITGMYALLNFCESYDYEPAFEFLLTEEFYTRLAIKHELFRLLNVLDRAKEISDEYIHYEIELFKENNIQDVNNVHVENTVEQYIKVILSSFVSNVHTDKELNNIIIRDINSKIIPEIEAVEISGLIINRNSFNLGILFMYNVEQQDRTSLYTDSIRFKTEGGLSEYRFTLYVPTVQYDSDSVNQIVLIPYFY